MFKKSLYLLVLTPMTAFAWPKIDDAQLAEVEAAFAKVYKKPLVITGADGVGRINTQTDHEYFEAFMEALIVETRDRAIKMRKNEEAADEAKTEIESKGNPIEKVKDK